MPPGYLPRLPFHPPPRWVGACLLTGVPGWVLGGSAQVILPTTRSAPGVHSAPPFGGFWRGGTILT